VHTQRRLRVFLVCFPLRGQHCEMVYPFGQRLSSHAPVSYFWFAMIRSHCVANKATHSPTKKAPPKRGLSFHINRHFGGNGLHT
jgi:hypothetical protein